MSKKQQSKEQLERSYRTVNAELHLDDMKSKADKVKAIIIAADKHQDTINNSASIIFDAYNEIQDRWPELGMSKKCWLDTIQLRRLQRDKNMSNDFINKVRRILDGTKNDTALRDAIINGLQQQTDTFKVPDALTEKTINYNMTEQIDAELIELLDKCVDCKNQIDGALLPKMGQYTEAFIYVTGRNARDFRTILDFYKMRNGGIPNEKTPPRAWKVVAGLRYLHDLFDEFEFDFISTWLQRFGIDAKFGLVSPTVSQWGNAMSEKFADAMMFKITDVALPMYAQYGIQPWHHLIKLGDYVYAYVWDTRVVELELPASIFKLEHLTTNYVDNCMPLICNKAEFTRPELLQFLSKFDLSELM